VTIEPTALATAVADPEIKEVHSTRSSLILPTQQSSPTIATTGSSELGS
jgi:hypothetical protein